MVRSVNFLKLNKKNDKILFIYLIFSEFNQYKNDQKGR